VRASHPRTRAGRGGRRALSCEMRPWGDGLARNGVYTAKELTRRIRDVQDAWGQEPGADKQTPTVTAAYGWSSVAGFWLTADFWELAGR